MPAFSISSSGSSAGVGQATALQGWSGWLFWCGVLPLALVLRSWRIEQQNLWLDELYSLDVARRPLTEIVRCAAADIHPPLFYILLKIWVNLFGDSAAAIRSLSVVASLAALVSVFRLVAPRYGGQMALTTVLLMTVSAHQIFFAQEARMYSIVMAFVLTALRGYAMWREAGVERGLAIYLWFALAAMYCHYFAVLAVVAINVHFGLSAFGSTRATTRRQARRWFTAQGVLALLYAPWLEVLVTQMQRGQSWRKPLTLAETGWQVVGYFQETTLGHAVYLDHIRNWFARLVVENLSLPASFFWQPLTFNIAFMVLLGALMSVGLWHNLKLARTDIRAALPLLFLGLPLLCASALAQSKGSMELGRYLIFTTPAVWLFIANGLHQVRTKWSRLVLIGLCVGTLFWQGTRIHYSTTARDSDLRPALERIRREARPGERVVIDPDALDVCLAYYAPRYGLESLTYAAQIVPTGEPTGHSQLERLKVDGDVKRAWIILDYRSALFTSPAFPGFHITRQIDFPSEYPKVRVIEVTR
ncbi:MAG: glycosyltransferase family 39 protein [Acidobacteriota bacterium]